MPSITVRRIIAEDFDHIERSLRESGFFTGQFVTMKSEPCDPFTGNHGEVVPTVRVTIEAERFEWAIEARGYLNGALHIMGDLREKAAREANR